MKKRYAAGLALALVGILSGCGQAETQPADNTISITPVERKTDGPQMDMAVKYDFAGNHADVNGMDVPALHLGRQRMGERGRDVYR